MAAGALILGALILGALILGALLLGALLLGALTRSMALIACPCLKENLDAQSDHTNRYCRACRVQQ